MNGAADNSAQRGATLLEVMVALGILATSYVALLQVHGGAIRLSAYSREVTIATFLARDKMEEIITKLDKEGFPDMDESEEGEFEQEGFPHFHWQLSIRKLELPVGAAFEQMAASMTGSKESSTGRDSQGLLERLGGNAGSGQLAEMIKGMGGGISGRAGGLGAAAAALLNPEALRGQAEMLGQMLEEAIREVNLTVTWGKGGAGETLQLTTHLVRVPSAGSASGTAPPVAGQKPGAPPLSPGVSPRLPPGGFRPGTRPAIRPNVPGGFMRGSAKGGFR